MLGVICRDLVIAKPVRWARPAASASDVMAWTILTLCACIRGWIALTTELLVVARKPTTNRLASGPIWTGCVRTGFHSGMAAYAGISQTAPPQASTSSDLAIPGINTPNRRYGAESRFFPLRFRA